MARIVALLARVGARSLENVSILTSRDLGRGATSHK
jgi:hypothetical protein